jgi:hypothetical protein
VQSNSKLDSTARCDGGLPSRNSRLGRGGSDPTRVRNGVRKSTPKSGMRDGLHLPVEQVHQDCDVRRGSPGGGCWTWDSDDCQRHNFLRHQQFRSCCHIRGWEPLPRGLIHGYDSRGSGVFFLLRAEPLLVHSQPDAVPAHPCTAYDECGVPIIHILFDQQENQDLPGSYLEPE